MDRLTWYLGSASVTPPTCLLLGIFVCVSQVSAAGVEAAT